MRRTDVERRSTSTSRLPLPLDFLPRNRQIETHRVKNEYQPVAVDPDRPYESIRSLYLMEEPALLASIHRRDRPAAIHIINRILVHVYSFEQTPGDLLKSLLLELIVMMSRAAVEAGAPQTEALGLRFTHLAELASIDEDENLSRWLRESVLRVFDAVDRHAEPSQPPFIDRILEIIRRDACGPIARDDVARRAGVSTPHLGALLRERTGRTFTELVREARIGRACDLLRGSDLPIAAVADECGFCDQSYFTHVFQDVKKTTPGNYRAEASDRKPSKTQKIRR
jgi:AraC-like DNA-binding protein